MVIWAELDGIGPALAALGKRDYRILDHLLDLGIL